MVKGWHGFMGGSKFKSQSGQKERKKEYLSKKYNTYLKLDMIYLINVSNSKIDGCP